MRYPEYVEVNGKYYKINTDFRVAIKCNQIAEDETIGDLERTMGIICTLFGDEAIDDGKENPGLYNILIELALKYLACGKEIDSSTNEKPDMDYAEDMDYIEASFMSDYHIDLSTTCMHWWKFFNLINGLSNSEIGNCCILNRIRNLRNYDTKDIKDSKERKKIEDAKRSVALKKYQKKKTEATPEQIKSAEEFIKALGL